jgi:hypothetical protein
MAGREWRMNNNECTSLLFLHNRHFPVAPGAPSPLAALIFSPLRPDPKA